MAKSKSSAFAFEDGLFNKNVNEVEEVREVEEVAEVAEVKKVEEVEEVEKLNNLIEVENAEKFLDLATTILPEQRTWVKIQARSSGMLQKEFLADLIGKTPVCSDPAKVINAHVKGKVQIRVPLPESRMVEFVDKAKTSNLNLSEFLWYMIALAQGKFTDL